MTTEKLLAVAAPVLVAAAAAVLLIALALHDERARTPTRADRLACSWRIEEDGSASPETDDNRRAACLAALHVDYSEGGFRP